jgi:Mce-associated membrane protein
MVTTDARRTKASRVRRRTVVRPSTAPEPTEEAAEPVTDSVAEDVAGPAEDAAVSEAADDAAVDEAVVDEEPAGPGRRGRLLAWALLLVLAAVLVAGGLLGRHWYDQRQLADARSQALAAARQTCVNFVSISASTVDSDLKRIADGATGQFKDEFTQDTAQVKAAVVQNKVDSHGSVLRAGVVSADRRSAVVLVAVDATVKNSSAPDGRLSHYRIQVNMARDAASGRWLVAQLQFVG